MRNVFEPNALELADLGGDTHFITDIQRQVEQLLTANSISRQHLKSELENLGSRAVPGILNAAYVFNDRLKTERDRNLLADLLANLIGSNEAARALLLKSGILEAPFMTTRDTALLALQKLGDIQPEELNDIRKRAWENAYQGEDYQSGLTLYRFLVAQGDQQGCSEVRYLAQETFNENLDIAPLYLDLALCCSPQSTYDILMETIGKMERTAKEFSKGIREMSVASITNFSEVLRAASTIYDVTRKTGAYAHGGIENLFTGPFLALFSEYPEKMTESGNMIQQKYPSLTRFFWQCLGRLLKFEIVKEYFARQLSVYEGEFVLEAAVQLFYIRGSNSKFKYWATELLEKLESDSPLLYSDAAYQFEIRFGKTVIDQTTIQKVEQSRLKR